MTRTFIEVPLFSKRWKEIGLGEDELQALQIMLLKDPESGPVMEGTGGIHLITAFEKKEQDNLTDDEKNVLKKIVKSLKEEAAKNRR